MSSWGVSKTKVDHVSSVEIIVLIRDIALISFLTIATLIMLLVFRRVKYVIGSVNRIIENVEEATNGLSDKIITSAKIGSTAAFTFGKFVSFFRKTSSKGKEEGEKQNG